MYYCLQWPVLTRDIQDTETPRWQVRIICICRQTGGDWELPASKYLPNLRAGELLRSYASKCVLNSKRRGSPRGRRCGTFISVAHTRQHCAVGGFSAPLPRPARHVARTSSRHTTPETGMFAPLTASYTHPAGHAAEPLYIFTRPPPWISPRSSAAHSHPPPVFSFVLRPAVSVVPLPSRTHYHVACRRIIRYNITYAVVSRPDLVEPTALLLQQSYRIPFSVRTFLSVVKLSYTLRECLNRIAVTECAR